MDKAPEDANPVSKEIQIKHAQDILSRLNQGERNLYLSEFEASLLSDLLQNYVDNLSPAPKEPDKSDIGTSKISKKIENVVSSPTFKVMGREFKELRLFDTSTTLPKVEEYDSSKRILIIDPDLRKEIDTIENNYRKVGRPSSFLPFEGEEKKLKYKGEIIYASNGIDNYGARIDLRVQFPNGKSYLAACNIGTDVGWTKDDRAKDSEIYMNPHVVCLNPWRGYEISSIDKEAYFHSPEDDEGNYIASNNPEIFAMLEETFPIDFILKKAQESIDRQSELNRKE